VTNITVKLSLQRSIAMQPQFLHGSNKKPRFPVPLRLPSQHYVALSQCVQVHKHALTNKTSYGRNCCLEQSPGTCLQPERQRSCFQAPAKDISVCTVLAQLTMRYANQHIGIDIVKRQRGGLRVSNIFTKYYHIQLHQNTS